MSPALIVVLVGPHGVGKTTLGQALSAETGLPFDPELGRALAEDPTFRPAGQGAEVPAPAFDAELFTRELARDLERGAAPRIIETWHPGNLAYAAARSPAVSAAFVAAVRAQVGELRRHLPILVQPLVAAPATLRARQSEPGDPDFYGAVGRAAGAWALTLGVPVAPALSTDRTTPPALARRVAALLHRHPLSTPNGHLAPRSLPCAWS
jgi:hypothetical protein